MSDLTATDRTSRLDRSLKTLVLFLACVVGLSGCPILETYTVTYSANGVDSGTVPVDGWEYQAGDEVVVRSNSGGLALSGYSFLGWNSAADGGGTSYSGGDTFVMGHADVTLYAKWSQNPTYTVTYFANGADDGMVPVDDRDYQAGDEVTARSNSGGLVLSGYTFTGWNTAANGDGTTYRSGDTFAMGRADITLFAAWSEHEEEEVTTYTVTYHANGATSGTPPVASSPAAKCLRHHVSPSLCPSIS